MLGLVSWHEVITTPNSDGPLDILITIGTSMAGLVILVAAESIFLTDVTKMLFTMISDRYLRRHRAKGREEGFVEAHKKWADWYERKVKAEDAGEDFDEPPPSYPNSNGSG